MKLLLAALALSAPTAAPAAVAPVTVPASTLDQLVLLLVPDQRMIDLVGASMRSEAQRAPELKGDKALADFVIARMSPDVEKIVRGALPELRSDMAKIIAADLSPGEIGEVYTFFVSPTGAKLQAVLYEVLAEKPGASDEEVQRLVLERLMSRLTLDDYGPLSTFGASSGAQKIQTLNPRIAEASKAWAERLIAANNARFATLRTQAIADYRRQHPETAK